MPKRKSEWSDGGTLPLEGRIELLEASIGFGQHTRMIDPENETPEMPAGFEDLGMGIVLDLEGHIHLPDQPCIPVRVPFLLDPAVFDNLINGLLQARREMAAHRDRS